MAKRIARVFSAVVTMGIVLFGSACGDDALMTASHEASLRCERLAACYYALGNMQFVDDSCDASTIHVVQRCGIGCITKLWEEHDRLRFAGETIPSGCRCVADADCGPDVRYCDTTTGACLDANITPR